MIGVISLIVGGYFMNQRLEYFGDSMGVVGTIVRIQESKGTKSQNVYHPVVTFTTESGETFTTVGEVGSSSYFDYEIGEQVDVRYLTDNPETAKLSSFTQMWLVPVVALVLGMLFIAAGIYNFKNPSAPNV